MRGDKGPAMTAQTRSRRTLQAPRGAAVTWGSRGMHVGNARQRQGWAGAAQGAHGSRQGTKCSQRPCVDTVILSTMLLVKLTKLREEELTRERPGVSLAPNLAVLSRVSCASVQALFS